MKNFLLALAAMALCACSTVPRVAPRFDRPSTQPIQKAHKAAIGHVQSAQQKLDTLEKSHEELKLQIDSIKVDLSNALTDLNTSEGARLALDDQLEVQTTKANHLADDYDTASAALTSMKASRHRWVTYFWYSSGLLALALLWVFRKPLLLLIAGL